MWTMSPISIKPGSRRCLPIFVTLPYILYELLSHYWPVKRQMIPSSLSDSLIIISLAARTSIKASTIRVPIFIKSARSGCRPGSLRLRSRGSASRRSYRSKTSPRFNVSPWTSSVRYSGIHFLMATRLVAVTPTNTRRCPARL